MSQQKEPTPTSSKKREEEEDEEMKKLDEAMDELVEFSEGSIEEKLSEIHES